VPEPTQHRAPAAVADNIEKMVRVENEARRPRSHGEALADAVARFAGTLSFVALQAGACIAWVFINAGKVPGIGIFDPFPYPLLSSLTSVEAVVLAAFVLIKQNRMSTVADRRDHIDLQVNLLTEREVTRVIQMLDRLSRKLGVEQHQDAESRELGEHIAVEHLVAELDNAQRLQTAPDSNP
jgi:uncharacterized membrane protein